MLKRVLLLNSDYSPLHFISDIDAITLFYKGRAEVVCGIDGDLSEWDEVYSSPSTSIRVPATMRVIKRVHRKWRQPRFRKRVLFNRDNWRCQYCNTPLVAKTVTIEHVLPSSRGGHTSWTNCVTACKPCNRKKGSKTPEEAGMKLLSKPVTPSAMDFWDAMKSNVWHKDWDLFLQKNH